MPREMIKLIPAVAVVVGMAWLSAAPVAYAQAYPVKPVRVLIPWPPGGSNDIVGRIVFQRLSETLGQPFVIENRAGASSTIGTELAARSAPDGHTVLINSATHIANAHLYIGVAAVMPQIKANRIRPLAVTSATRITQFPEIPTLTEAGVPGYEFTAWIGSFVPARTPSAIVDRLNAELRKAMEHPDVAKTLGVQTLDPMHMSPEQFAMRLRSDYDKYERVIRISGARFE